MPLAPLDGVVDTGLLERGRPILVLDPAGFLGRLGLPGPALECAPLQGRMLSAVPIAGEGGADALLLVVIDDPAPEPGVFGPLETLAAHAAGVLRRARLHDDLEGAYLATVTALANALEAKDADTHDHATETSHLAVAVGRRLGLRGEALRNLEFAAVLHDVGKIAIPDEILNRKGPLTDAEWEHVRDHTRIGERILRDIPFLAPAASAVRSAHERWDGAGYPDGLMGEDIPLASRIVFACDTWSVMTSERPYRAALDGDEALRRLYEAAGSQLDPAIVETLVSVLGDVGRGGPAPHPRRGLRRYAGAVQRPGHRPGADGRVRQRQARRRQREARERLLAACSGTAGASPSNMLGGAIGGQSIGTTAIGGASPRRAAACTSPGSGRRRGTRRRRPSPSRPRRRACPSASEHDTVRRVPVEHARDHAEVSL